MMLADHAGSVLRVRTGLLFARTSIGSVTIFERGAIVKFTSIH